MTAGRVRSVEQKLLDGVRYPDSGCWEWTGAHNQGGYGRVRTADGLATAHRVAYELWAGPIPDGLQLDHLCRNRACINPAHLEPVTNRENVLRGLSPTALNAKKTHCLRGHELHGPNLLPSRTGRRVCRACRRRSAAA